MNTVCILFGGVSSEHDVSLRSAAAVLRNMPKAFKAEMLGISREGRWLRYTGGIEDIENGSWAGSPNTCPAVLSPDRKVGGLLLLEESGVRRVPVDLVFPVLHGKNGEDGTVQGLLELAGIPYVGCGVFSSALCMDKAAAHIVLEAAGIPKTKLIALKPTDRADPAALEKRLAEALGYPMFLKPANAGSSVGVTRVKDASMLEAALDLAFLHDSKVVAERAVTGQEVECAVMGAGEPVASAVLGEIVPPDGVYDYESKYLNDTAGLYIPALVPENIVSEIRELAVRAYRALDCRGLSRVDFFVTKEGRVILNEVNTIPGFTSISMFPKLFEASGMSFTDLVEKLLLSAL